jgi:hypothetical protein
VAKKVPMEGSFEHGDEPSGYIKADSLLSSFVLRTYQLFKKDILERR